MRYSGIAFVLLLMFQVGVFAAPQQEHFFDSAGVKIRYWDEGEGEPVLLIHGLAVTGHFNWVRPGIQQALSEKYRVIMPDVRNHGKSGDAPDGEHGVEVVEDMIRLLDHVGVDSAHIVGYSMGGTLTIKMSTMYPLRVRSALVGGTGWVNSESEESKQYANDETPGRIGPPRRGFAELGTTADEMRSISIPLRVIIGTNDGGQRVVNLWKEIVPDLDVVLVDGATHLSCMFAPEFKAGIQSFIAENSRK